MTLKIQRPSVSVALTRFFRLTGQVAPELEEFVQPTVQVGDLSPAEPPPVARAAAARVLNSAVPVEFPTFRLFCPPGMIARLDSIYLNVPAQAIVSYLFTSSVPALALAGLASPVFTDQRLGQLNPVTGLARELPAVQFAFGSIAGALIVNQYRQLIEPSATGGFRPLFRPKHWIIGSGEPGVSGFLEFQTSVVNSTVRCALEWTEFQLP